MKYKKPIIDITLLSESDIVCTSDLKFDPEYTDGDFQNNLGGQM